MTARTGYQIAKDRMTAALQAEAAQELASEAQIHTAIVELLQRTAAPGVVFWHCPNGGKRNVVEAKKLKGMGVLAGVADLQISIPGRMMVFLEIKGPKGRVEKSQIAFLDAMACNGHVAHIVRSVKAAEEILKFVGAIRVADGIGRAF